MNSRSEILTNGLIGTGFPALGLITSMQEQVNYWLQITSLVIGIAVGLITLWRMLRK